MAPHYNWFLYTKEVVTGGRVRDGHSHWWGIEDQCSEYMVEPFTLFLMYKTLSMTILLNSMSKWLQPIIHYSICPETHNRFRISQNHWISRKNLGDPRYAHQAWDKLCSEILISGATAKKCWPHLFGLSALRAQRTTLWRSQSSERSKKTCWFRTYL